jgi:hypothetical protein
LIRALLLAALLLPGLAEARIPRDHSQVRAFRNENPCPATGLKRGACPGFEVDHVTPLCAGGEDRPSNMQWLSKEDHRFKTRVDVRECRRMHK